MAGRHGKKPRGEVHEVIGALEHLSTQSGAKPDVVQAKRECFQKLIRYMTQAGAGEGGGGGRGRAGARCVCGIDMSLAFVPATKCVALSKFDLPLKKMLYLYLRTAARQNPAVALLVVQTLLTDCKDSDPTIRGLAVRSMCSLRVPDLMDSVYQAVDDGLRDTHPYVREAAVIGVLKCLDMDPAGVRMRGLLDRVEGLLTSDPDPQVVANCLWVMQQCGALDGLLTRELVISLLNHIRAFSDWAQCLVLDIVARYQPASEAERFDILETLALGREPEIVFAVLSNFLVLAQRYPAAFSQLYPDFFCRYEDPSYLKQLKIEVLIAIANHTNAYDIAEEMAQYVRDVDEDLARDAIRAVAQIALKVPDVNGILDRLLLFLGYTDKPHVIAEALIQMTDVLRRRARAAVRGTPTPPRPAWMRWRPSAWRQVWGARTVSEPAARAAYAWVLGEWGHKVQDAPYVLEEMAGGFADEEPEVKLRLLTAAAKLFFKRPPEARPALGAALAAGAADANQDVHDRALLYYRLLQHSVGAAQAVIAAPRPPATRFTEAQTAETQDRIFDELNSLSVVYRAPAATFVDVEELERYEQDSIGEGAAASTRSEAESAAAQATVSLLDLEDGGAAAAEPPPSAASVLGSAAGAAAAADIAAGALADLLTLGGGGGRAASSSAAPVPAGGGGVDLLGGLSGLGPPAPAAPAVAAAAARAAAGGLEDLLGGFGGGAPAAAPAPPPPQGVSLLPQPAITPQEFQAKWGAWTPQARTFQVQLSLSAVAAVGANGYRDFTQHVGQAHIVSFATPREGSQPPYRFLFHAQRAGSGGSQALVQVAVALAPAPAASAIVKSDDPALAEHVVELLQTLLLTL
eukprot:scaffold5.g646.t1